jgi:hypothetical protein
VGNRRGLQHNISVPISSLVLVSCVDFYSNVKIEATSSSEKSADCQLTTRRYTSEYKTFYLLPCSQGAEIPYLRHVVIFSLPSVSRFPM